MRNRLRYLALFTALTPLTAAAQDMPPAQVEVVQVTRQAMTPTVQLKGNVMALKNAVVSAEVDGRLEDIVLVGTLLQKGQQLGQINPDRYEFELARERAELKALRADLTFRNNEVARLETLIKQDNASATQYQRELAAKQVVEQNILAAQADVARAERNKADTTPRAPFDGVIAERLANIGEFIRAGEPLVRIVNSQQKDISVPVPLRYEPLLREGMQLDVTSRDRTFTLPVRSVVPVGDMNSRMIEVRLDASDSELLAGDAVTVLVPKAPSGNEVAIPRDALIIKGNDRFIYVVDANNKAQKVTATIRYAHGPYLVLEEGVNDGDYVIIRGGERLQPGSLVQY
ncbi:efflux RND transporter periplasmic adaptor subunit [Alteromonas sp. CYL-A6]|uniref:efflux RND transporter periplasmic adaptor subunit n=1 Tax=Alteromonas nitratireducens TaxID=3390813 RepID=UPI0034C21DC9